MLDENISSPVSRYDSDDFNFNLDMSNKLFCTFTTKENVEGIVQVIRNRYHILYDKIFVLQCLGKDELIVTYNVDFNNIGEFLDDTILVHRKKHTNTLYTINALNELIIELNNGYLDKNFMINWDDYKNSVLLTKESKLEIIQTKLFEIIHI